MSPCSYVIRPLPLSLISSAIFVTTFVLRCSEFNSQIYLFLRLYQTDNLFAIASSSPHNITRRNLVRETPLFRLHSRTEIGRGCRESWSSLSYRFQEGEEEPEDHPAQSWLAVGVRDRTSRAVTYGPRAALRDRW